MLKNSKNYFQINIFFIINLFYYPFNYSAILILFIIYFMYKDKILNDLIIT